MNPGNFTFSTINDQSLFGRAWVSTEKNVKGIILLIHDLGEHSGRYDSIAKRLTKAGYHLTSFDLRGHGLSPGTRGDAPGFANLIDDIDRFFSKSTEILGNSLPKFFYGQGTGGNLVILYGLQNHSDMSGAIISSPALRIKVLPDPAKKRLFFLYFKILPFRKIKSFIQPDALSRNMAIVNAYQNDVYNHNHLSARLGFEFIKSGLIAMKLQSNGQFLHY